MNILLKNVHTDLNDTLYDLHINNGKIQNIVKSASFGGSFDKVIDCGGAYAFSGLVDMHCHLREPGYEYKEDILSGSMAAYK